MAAVASQERAQAVRPEQPHGLLSAALSSGWTPDVIAPSSSLCRAYASRSRDKPHHNLSRSHRKDRSPPALNSLHGTEAAKSRLPQSSADMLTSTRMAIDYKAMFERLTKRYGGATPQALESILCPVLIPIRSLDKTIQKLPRQNHYRASFTIDVTDECAEFVVPGRTGKFVPAAYKDTGGWREIAKGRILSVDARSRTAQGEVYCGGRRSELEAALQELTAADLLEIDQYGASAKVLSGLVEYSLVQVLKDSGYSVRRMPEDMAQHIGTYLNYDFQVEKDGIIKKVEVKSLWGTNTRFARLIHSLTDGYPTSSCKFATQDFFAVSLFLRTGNIRDFAFARSVSDTLKPYGLPPAEKHPDHVNQNPTCQIGDGKWFASLDDVWNLD